jgi:hypothetical protein
MTLSETIGIATPLLFRSIGQTPDGKCSAKIRKETLMDDDERISRIRERAYERWVKYGGSHPIADWLEAEREIDAEGSKTEVGDAKSATHATLHASDDTKQSKGVETTEAKEIEKPATRTMTNRG